MWRIQVYTSDVLGKPELAVLNAVIATALIAIFLKSSRLLIRNIGRVGWFTVFAGLLWATKWIYFPGYTGTHYKEAEIPEHEFIHGLLLFLFYPVPLLALLTFAIGGLLEGWPGIKASRRPKE